MTELDRKNDTKNDTFSKRHADHTSDLQRLRMIKGQVEGVEKMIRDGRYCPDILIQVKAATAALRSVELSILERHIRHCLGEAISSKNKKDAEKKIEEIILILGRKGN